MRFGRILDTFITIVEWRYGEISRVHCHVLLRVHSTSNNAERLMFSLVVTGDKGFINFLNIAPLNKKSNNSWWPTMRLGWLDTI